MKKFKRMGAAAVAVLAAVSLTACGSTEKAGEGGKSKQIEVDGKKYQIKGSDYLPAKYDELAEGKQLNFALTELPEQENPFHQDASAYTSTLWYWYNPQIVLFDDDAKAYANPEYLTSMKSEVKDGKTIVTYVINPKAQYNDGSPIDWKSFETTWKINSGDDEGYSPNSTDGYQDIESVKPGKDDREAVVTFKRIFPWWEGLFNMVAHPKLADHEFYQKGYLNTMHPELGAGPYKLENVDFNKKIVTFVPNEKWWGKKGKLTKIVYTVMEDQAAVNAFMDGSIDIIGAASKDMQAKLQNKTDISLYNAALPSSALLMLNSKSPNLQDIKVREAVFCAIDRAKIGEIRFQGVKMPDKDGKLTIPFQEPNPGSFTLFSFQEGYEDNFGAAVKYDPKKSESLLDEAGWKKGDSGIREKDGNKLELTMPLLGDDPTVKALVLAYQQMLKSVGIQVNIKQRPTKEFSQVYTKREFDIFSLGFRSSDPFGVAYFGQIYGSDSGLNLSNTGTKEFDQKIAELQKLPTAEEQIKKANELEQEAFKLYGIMPLYNGPSITATKKGLANLGSNGFTIIPKELIGWKK